MSERAARSDSPGQVGSVHLPGDRVLISQTVGTAPLAIASITAVLRDLLANGLIRYSSVTRLGDVNVSVLPPDRITVGSEEPNQLNVFMYSVAPHSSLKHKAPLGADRGPRPQRLTLDLHYLVTAYGAQDYHSEILLGCAVHLLGRTPVLTRDIIREALTTSSPKAQKAGALSPARSALASSDVIDEDGRIRVTQQFLTFEEMSKMWSVLQARYRPSVTYEVSAVGVSLEG